MVSKKYVKAVIMKLYWKEMKSLRQVARHLGISHVSLYEYMVRHMIPIRSRSEAHENFWKKYRRDFYE